MAIARDFSKAAKYKLEVVDASDKQGKAHALNVGIGHSSTEKILFIDQDDTVNSSYVSSMSAALDYTPFVASSMDSFLLNRGFDVMPRYLPRDQKIGQFMIKLAAGGTIGITKDALGSIGMFNEEFDYSTNDVEFCVRAHYAGYELRLVKDAILNYRFRKGIRDNYIQGVYYGEGNYSLAQIYPEVRGDQKRLPSLAIDVIYSLVKLAFLSKGREKHAHQLGKEVGQMRSKLKNLDIL